MNIAVFASGNGTNVQAIIDAVRNGTLKANIKCLVCDNHEANVIDRAKKAGIEVLVKRPNDYVSRYEWEHAIISFLKAHGVDMLVLAGFMRIIGDALLKQYPNRIINIHPSLLPAFPGRSSIKEAFLAKVKTTGVTIHFVDEGIDTGEIIAQEELNMMTNWTLEELEEEIHKIEHRLYPLVIQQLINDFSKKGSIE